MREDDYESKAQNDERRAAREQKLQDKRSGIDITATSYEASFILRILLERKYSDP